MADTLDEKVLRKPGFSEGPRVTLGDGQEWTFPRPWIRLYPKIDDDGKVTIAGGNGYGAEHEDAIFRLLDLSGQENSGFERLGLRFQLAANLLLRNYNLDNAALRDLLVLDDSRSETDETWQEIDRILYGLAPKASPVG